MRSYYDLASFYWHFIHNLSTFTSQLTKVIKKSAPFKWEEEKEKAFKLIKDKLAHVPLLALPNFTKTLEIECDALGIDIGGVLMKEGRPIAYFSETLGRASLNYPTYDKEFMY